MGNTKTRLLSLLLGLVMLPVWLTTPAEGTNVMGVEVGMASYAIDTKRIYQGDAYAAELHIGENMTFTGELNQGLPHETLWACIDRALAEEHLTRQDVIDTNKMVADLLKKMKNPKNFWDEVDFYADILGVKVYSDTVKSLAGSAMDAGEGVYQNVTAQQREFIRQELDRALGDSLGDWVGGKSGDGVKQLIENSPTDYKMIKEGLEAVPGVKYIDKAYKVLSGAWKIVERENQQSKDFEALKERAMKRYLLVEAFYKRAGELVRDYLKDFGQWQLTINSADGGTIEQMTKLNFACGQANGTFANFYTIQPVLLTWRAEAFFTQEKKTDSPNGAYTGSIAVTGEYDGTTLKEHVIPLVQKFESFSYAITYSKNDTARMQAYQRSKPSVKQTWRADSCRIEILGLAENGAATITLPNLQEEKDITLDFELSGSFTEGGYTYTGYDEVCTPEQATQPVMDLPETHEGEVLNWAYVSNLASTVQGGSGMFALNSTLPAEPYEDGTFGDAFIIRTSFDEFTGYKRIEVKRN